MTPHVTFLKMKLDVSPLHDPNPPNFSGPKFPHLNNRDGTTLSAPGLFWRLNNVFRNSRQIEKPTFSSLLLQIGKLSPKRVESFSQGHRDSQCCACCGRSYEIAGDTCANTATYLFKPIRDFLKTSWIHSLSLPGLDLHKCPLPSATLGET